MEKVRENVKTGLYNLYNNLRDLPKPTLSDEDIANFRLIVEDLNISATPAAPVFFEPMSVSELRRHPVANDDYSQYHLSMANKALEMAAARPPSKRNDLSTAAALSSHLAWEMSEFLRESMENFPRKTLLSLTNWRIREQITKSMIKRGLRRTIFLEQEPCFAPDTGWHTNDETTLPHLMFTMKHGIDGDDNLLRGELLTIVGAMRSRMSVDIFAKHVIIPVLIFSFMGRQHGRIVQAWYDGEYLVVRKSRLIELTDPAINPFSDFIRFAANKPVGETRHLPAATKGTIPIYADPEAQDSAESTQHPRVHAKRVSHRQRGSCSQSLSSGAE